MVSWFIYCLCIINFLSVSYSLYISVYALTFFLAWPSACSYSPAVDHRGVFWSLPFQLPEPGRPVRFICDSLAGVASTAELPPMRPPASLPVQTALLGFYYQQTSHTPSSVCSLSPIFQSYLDSVSWACEWYHSWLWSLTWGSEMCTIPLLIGVAKPHQSPSKAHSITQHTLHDTIIS